MNKYELAEAKIQLRAKGHLKIVQAEPKVEGGLKTWFFCRQLHFVGVGEVLYVYPTNIGHGPETPLCSIKGQIMNVDSRYEDFQGTIHQDDLRHSKKESIRGLMKILDGKSDKRRGEMTDLIHLEAKWGRML